ncbi:MAG: hypothetical protein Q7J35_18265 [Candidatus Methanoperedens sp.]|nr:hypothetical protein [Candidatus Methanoperedens sp.]
MKRFIADERAWADFFITRIGLILFASVLLLSAFKIYPMFIEKEAISGLDATASDITSKIEAVDSVTVPGFRYVHVFDEKDRLVRIGISTEYVAARVNISTPWGERELVHAEPLVVRVYPSNSNWSNTSGLRKKLGDLGAGKNGDVESPLDLSRDKNAVDSMFSSIEHELARTPFVPEMNRSLIIEKVIIHYIDGNRSVERDYVIIYQ